MDQNVENDPCERWFISQRARPIELRPVDVQAQRIAIDNSFRAPTDFACLNRS